MLIGRLRRLKAQARNRPPNWVNSNPRTRLMIHVALYGPCDQFDRRSWFRKRRLASTSRRPINQR